MDDVISRLGRNGQFVVKDGIPRHQSLLSSSQQQTSDSFGFKWAQRDTYESPAVQASIAEWLRQRYALTEAAAPAFVRGRRILDAGCGAANSALLLFGKALDEASYLGVDVSTSVDVAAQRFRERGIRGEFVQVSLDEIPPELGNFDIIFSEGVLHHTDSTERALKTLAARLDPGGVFMFYVYRKKGPIREFSDDFVRHAISGLSDEDAWKALMPLSKLGQAIGRLNAEVEIEEPVDILGIPAGKIDVQRLFYWHVMKMYYRSDWTLDEMNHVNFDWFRPLNCHRHSPEEITRWCGDAGLGIERMDVQEAGITVVARRP